jgi:hypothetical protein
MEDELDELYDKHLSTSVITKMGQPVVVKIKGLDDLTAALLKREERVKAEATLPRLLNIKAVKCKARIQVYQEVVGNWDKPGFKQYILTLYDNDLKLRKRTLDEMEAAQLRHQQQEAE